MKYVSVNVHNRRQSVAAINLQQTVGNIVNYQKNAGQCSCTIVIVFDSYSVTLLILIFISDNETSLGLNLQAATEMMRDH